MWWDCVFKKQKTEQNRKKGRGRKRRKKRRRNCSKKWLGTVRIAGSRGLALSAGELFQWANETVRRTSEVSVLLFFFFNFSRLFHNPLVLSFPSSKFRQTSARWNSEYKWTWLGCQSASRKHTHFLFAASRVQAKAEAVSSQPEFVRAGNPWLSPSHQWVWTEG